MKEKLAKLIDVKTIVTLAIVGAVITLAVTGKINPEKISDMAFMIVSFFFGVKVTEKALVK